MKKVHFSKAIHTIVQRDRRYHREAYFFLRNALDYTIRSLQKTNALGLSRHVSAKELLEGLRAYAISEFGPMVPIVFEFWGIKEPSDFGHMVFNLVEHHVFGTTEADRLEDFYGVYDFQEAFVAPFLPESKRISSSKSKLKPY